MITGTDSQRVMAESYEVISGPDGGSAARAGQGRVGFGRKRERNIYQVEENRTTSRITYVNVTHIYIYI